MSSIFGLIVQSSLFIGSGIVTGIWSHRFFYRKNSDGGRGTFLIQLLSDFTVAFSAIVAELVLCEIGDWVAPEARFVVWKVATTVLLGLVGLVIPFAEIMTLTGSGGGQKVRVLFGLILYGVYLVLFVSLGHYIPMEGSESGSNISWSSVASRSDVASGTAAATTTYNASLFAADLQLSFSESIITRIGFVGVTAMAILSGVSTVSAPFTVFISRPNPVNQSDIERLQAAIATTGSLIQTKKHSCQSLRLKLSHRINTSSSSNLMLKVLTTLRVGTGDDLTTEIKALDSEISSLQSMKSDLERDLDSVKSKYHDQLYSLTVQGRIKTRLYFIFAFYCLYRLINILIIRNPLIISWDLPRRIYGLGTSTSATGESDALVISLAHMAIWISPHSDIDALSRQIGFAVSGLLFLASISSVVTTFSTLTKAFPFLHSRKHHPHLPNTATIHLTALIISQVLAIYVISTSLLLRSNLPSKMSSAITSALGSPLNVSSVQAWSDSVIFVSTCIMVLGLYIAHKYRSSDDIALYDEESFIESKFD